MYLFRLTKHRKSYLDNYMKEVSSKVSRVKSEKNSAASLQKMKEVAHAEADKVRSMSR